jgi:hypothetical protein
MSLMEARLTSSLKRMLTNPSLDVFTFSRAFPLMADYFGLQVKKPQPADSYGTRGACTYKHYEAGLWLRQVVLHSISPRDGNYALELRYDFPVPKPGPGELLLKMNATGLCLSDHHQLLVRYNAKLRRRSSGALPCRVCFRCYMFCLPRAAR